MSNIFASLASGTKFSGKRNQEAIDIFRSKASKQSKQVIDIFGTDNTDKAVGNKRKTEDEEEDSDVESQNSGSDSESEDEKPEVALEKDDEINAFRNRMQIKVKGDKVPKPSATFYTMDIEKDLKPIIIGNIEKSDWKEPTPIQMQAIPTLLSGRDVLACAPTGSGKTAAL